MPENFKRNDKVTGWFGDGVVTDAAELDDLLRVLYRDGGKRKYTYVAKRDVARA